jgi:response regulator RpfG family c-di-GMP phosphodiesterase/serine/threonine protein kinase
MSVRLPSLDPLLAPLPGSVRPLAAELLAARLLDPEPLAHFLEERRDALPECSSVARLAQALFRHNLLTAYQRERVLSGQWRQLLLGNYRILDVLGSGGMGTVFRGEHCLLRRKVALKVVPLDEDLHPTIRQRFYAEMHALAELNHPHVVGAIDAGEVAANGREGGAIYLVLELVNGGDLEAHVEQHGPCSVSQACDFIRQAAAGLHAAHDRHLIHRDLKPSNLLLTDEGQVKLVDFGLARRFDSRWTDHRALLGSIDFMPPEQSIDPSSVGKEADIYGLGATLFWLLTAQPPYPPMTSTTAALDRLLKEPPRRVRSVRPDVPEELDDLVARMLDRNPAKRPAPPLLVMHALTPFVFADEIDTLPSLPPLDAEPVLAAEPVGLVRTRRILLLSEAEPGESLARSLTEQGLLVQEAGDVEEAQTLLRHDALPLVVVDLPGPPATQAEICRHLRARSTVPLLKVLVLADEPTILGADDVLPASEAQRLLRTRVELLLKWKDAQERVQVLTAQNQVTAHQLHESLRARGRDVREAHDALLFAMAKMAESREGETPGHLKRLQQYSRALASTAATMLPWQAFVDARFLELLERCIPLHDIGKIGLPENLLRKPGTLTNHERKLIETHPLIGDRILAALARAHGTSLEFLGTARALVRHHHERYDGTGYPDRLVGEAIPAVARLTALADVYDALRRDRVHKRAMSHDEAVRVVLNQSAGQFDPILVEAFSTCHPRFEEIFQEISD